MSAQPSEAFTRLLECLDRLEVHYMVGGSAASGVHGHVRTTRDIDLVMRIDHDGIEALVEELQGDFYIDADDIKRALEYKRSFNVIHFQSAFKFDIFPLGDDRYDQVQFGRRMFAAAALFGQEPIEFAVASPEDTILSKLRWYRLGARSSEQQWNDVLGVIAVQRDRFDYAYLREWAAYLKIADLLEEALAERHEEMP